ncbi:Crp/Fnr family transcriptional regulator [Aquimarina rhabdastrellae]
MNQNNIDFFNQNIYKQDFKLELLKKGKKTKYRPNDIVTSSNNLVPYVGLITDGVIKVTMHISNKEFFLYYLNAKNNFIIDDMNMISGNPMNIIYTTMTNAEIHWVPKYIIDKWQTKYPKFEKAYFLTMQINLDLILMNLNTIQSNVLKDRLFSFLKETAIQLETSIFEIDIKTLSNDMNTSIRAIFKALRELEKECKIKRLAKDIVICE